MLRNNCPSCNLIGSAQIPAEEKVNAKKVNQSYQTHFCIAEGVVWGQDYLNYYFYAAKCK